MRFTILFLVLIAGCGSAPEKSKSTPAAAVPGTYNTVALTSVIAYAPRRGRELESAVLTNPKVQSCLRLAPEIREEKFSAGVEGYLDYRGVIETVTVTAPSEPLRACLAKEITSLAMGRGRAGPFKMQVNRALSTENNSKSVLLDLRP